MAAAMHGTSNAPQHKLQMHCIMQASDDMYKKGSCGADIHVVEGRVVHGNVRVLFQEGSEAHSSDQKPKAIPDRGTRE